MRSRREPGTRDRGPAPPASTPPDPANALRQHEIDREAPRATQLLVPGPRFPVPDRPTAMNAATISAQPPATGDRLGVTLLFSVIVHAVLILGIGFELAKTKPSLPALDVT